MNPREFRQNAPGRLMEIATHGNWAFVPNELPHDWHLPLQLWPHVAEVHQKLGELDGYCRALKNPQFLMKSMRDQEALDSSTIEGTQTTPAELLRVQQQKTKPTHASQPSAAQEVENHVEALRSIEEMKTPLTLQRIQDIHRTLMTGARGENKSPGEFRTTQVAIGRQLKFVPPPPQELPRLLDNFSVTLADRRSQVPLVDAFIQHYQFEAIHPFLDGNRRTGRVILTHSIARNCGMSRPWLLLSNYFERHRRRYLDCLQRVSTHGDWTNWIEFCLKGTREQAAATIHKCGQLISLQADFESRIAPLRNGGRLMRIMEMLYLSQYVGVSEVGLLPKS